MNAHPFLADDLVYRSLLAKVERLEKRLAALERQKPTPTPARPKAQRDRGPHDDRAFAGMESICLPIAAETGFTLEELRGRNRSPEFVAARRRAVQACVEAGFSTPVVGRFFDWRDHTTVLQMIGRKVR